MTNTFHGRLKGNQSDWAPSAGKENTIMKRRTQRLRSISATYDKSRCLRRYGKPFRSATNLGILAVLSGTAESEPGLQTRFSWRFLMHRWCATANENLQHSGLDELLLEWTKGSRKNKPAFWHERRAGRCEAPRRHARSRCTAKDLNEWMPEKVTPSIPNGPCSDWPPAAMGLGYGLSGITEGIITRMLIQGGKHHDCSGSLRMRAMFPGLGRCC
jgi:hypothetical protein